MERTGAGGRITTALAGALLVAALAAHVYAVVVRADREPHMDETEYMHAAWMMANGERLYETFFEHHSPFLFEALAPLAPHAEAVDVRPFFVHARWLVGAFGLIALLSLGVVLWQAAPEAAPIAILLLLATGPMWLRGFAEVRAEPFALAFFWLGAALVITRKPWLAGFGAGLVAVSGLWNPKWPLTIVAVGVVWFVRYWRSWRSILAATLTFAAGFAALRLCVRLDLWWFFNFDVNVALTSAVQSSQQTLDTYFEGGKPFLFVPDAFHPWITLPAALLVLASAFLDRKVSRVLSLVLFAAAFLELRFVLPWPGIWSHYYLMWSVAAAAVLGLVPSAVRLLADRVGASVALGRALHGITASAAIFLAGAHALAMAPVTGDRAPYWVSQRYLTRQLRPGDVVWIEPTRHPVSIRDAHYYWFSVGQMSANAEAMRKTARGARYLPPPEPDPVCAPPPNLRFTLNPRRAGLVDGIRCMEKLLATGQVRQTPVFDVYEVRLLESEVEPSPAKGAQ